MVRKKRLIIGSIAIFLLGSAFHFLFDMLGRSVIAAPFFAVNESIWEHMKLLSTAALVWLTADYFLADKAVRPSFFAARAISLPASLLVIPVVYYFLKGAFGIENTVVDIALFLVASALYQYIAMRMENCCAALSKHNIEGLIVLCAIFLLFAVFTFLPPHVPLFVDGPTGGYGIQ
jgi:hypothetical protein